MTYFYIYRDYRRRILSVLRRCKISRTGCWIFEVANSRNTRLQCKLRSCLSARHRFHPGVDQVDHFLVLAIPSSTQPSPDLSQSEAAAIQADFRSLDTLIDKYQRYLIPMDQLQRNQPYETRCRLVAYTLGHVATIQLHSRFASRNTTSNQKCLAAASSVVRVLDTADLTGVLFLNPIMGVSVYASRVYC